MVHTHIQVILSWLHVCNIFCYQPQLDHVFHTFLTEVSSWSELLRSYQDGLVVEWWRKWTNEIKDRWHKQIWYTLRWQLASTKLQEHACGVATYLARIIQLHFHLVFWALHLNDARHQVAAWSLAPYRAALQSRQSGKRHTQRAERSS